VSYIILRGRWCDIIVLNVHAPTADKIDDMKDIFYEELERVFYKFPKYHMKIHYNVLLDFIFKPPIANESLHEMSNDSGGIAVNFATSKNLTVGSTIFPHHNIRKCTSTLHEEKTHTQDEPYSKDRRRHPSILDARSSRAAD
jgi:hypothetical protein